MKNLQTDGTANTEPVGKLVYFALFLMLFGMLQERLTDSGLITVVSLGISSWLWTWIFRTGTGYTWVTKFPRWHKWLYHWGLITSVIISLVFIVWLIGSFFFGWELR